MMEADSETAKSFAITGSATLAMVLSSMAMTVLNETARTANRFSVSFSWCLKVMLTLQKRGCLYAGMPAAKTPFLSIFVITL
jgi:hypothetical protein